MVVLPPRQRGRHRGGGVGLSPEHPGVTGAMGPSTSWDPWPRPAKMASRSCFGSFVYTVATREGHARGRGDAGVYTDWRKWPLGAVLRHLCTLLRCCRQMWRRRSVHRSAKMTSRRRFGAFVYTVVTRGSRASGAAARLAPLPRQQPTQTPEEPAIETGQVSGPIGARFGRFRLVGRLWCVERCARLTKRARAGRPPRPSRTGRTQPT